MSTARRLAAPLLLALLLTGFHSANASQSWGFNNDSYRYSRAALEFLGLPRGEAQVKARDAYCASRSELTACLAANPQGVKPDHPRYERIFDTRPGYPLLAAPFIAVFGALKGLWVLSFLLTATSGLLTYTLLRISGLSRLPSLAGEAVLLTGGLGYWGTRALADSLVTPCLLLCGIGSVYVLMGRRRAGLGALLGGLLVLALTKYSTALLLAVTLAAASALYAWRTTRHVPRRFAPTTRTGERHRAWTTLTVASAGAALWIGAVTALLGLPAASETMQDTLTRYFTRPDVPDPVQGMLALEVTYWPTWFHYNVGFALLLGLCLWALWRHRPQLLPIALATGLTGLGTAFAHPLLEELDRLWVVAWVPVALGVPVLVQTLGNRGGALLPPARSAPAAREPDRTLTP
ncbi:hypothetical protein G6045_11230 [Streptomyces sp. YC504]|uniref:Glycosyltransferase RgtA/B/C/D-like domain-containing protein n=1 Tax=Streptomyces mesophilus TaxID=1775132 RepID=A0A6G4XFC1_9ACTN|nr:hypothetical protein [Streptomyces mesophilus]NGO76235.1 hypothetical protein [Streptomyces mesophilus]